MMLALLSEILVDRRPWGNDAPAICSPLAGGFLGSKGRHCGILPEVKPSGMRARTESAEASDIRDT